MCGVACVCEQGGRDGWTEGRADGGREGGDLYVQRVRYSEENVQRALELATRAFINSETTVRALRALRQIFDGPLASATD
jgi:hypothetical protein